MEKGKILTEEDEIGGKNGTNMPSNKQAKQKQKDRAKMAASTKKKGKVDDGPLTTPMSNPIRVDHVPCIAHKMNDERWLLSRIKSVCLSERAAAEKENPFQTLYGNMIFQAWENNIDAEIWAVCSDPSHPFLGIEGADSWETMVEHFLAAHKGDWLKAERSIRVSLDRYAPQMAPMFIKTRQLVMAISRCDPISLFSLSQEESPTTWCNWFWDKCNARNPRLLVEQRPIVKFWLISSFIVGYPWVDPAITDAPQEYDALQKPAQEERKRERGNDSEVATEADGLAQSATAPVDPISPMRGGFVEPLLKIVQDPEPPPKQSKTHRENQPDGWDLSNSSNAVTPVGEERQNDAQETGNWSESEDGQKKQPALIQQPAAGGAPLASIEIHELPIRTAKSVAFQQLSGGTTTQVPSNKEKFQSDAELAHKTHQIRMDGIPRKHSKFVCLSVATTWPGEEEADVRLQDQMANVIVEGMVQAIEQISDIMFLPVGDYTFAHQDKWIRTVEEAKKITTWDKLRQYLDLSWNNGFNLPRQSKTPGDKTLRTRIRIAFDSETELVESILDDFFRPTGYGMGIYRSPMQVGNAAKIGWLLNYPVGMGREAIERELMRHFKFTFPIALVLAYPANPGAYNEKWVSGLHKHAWHVYVPFQNARNAEQELTLWLTKTTLKRDMPFGALTQFVVDWNYAKNADQAAPVQDLNKDIIQMINTHDTHCHTTEVIKPTFPIHPLVKTHVPFFDKSVSLLRILYSIQCHPFVPDKKKDATATETEHQVAPLQEAGSSKAQADPTETSVAADGLNIAKLPDSDQQGSQPDDQAESTHEDIKSPDKKKRKDNTASSQPVASKVDATSATKTPERKKKGKRKRKKASTPSKKNSSQATTPQQEDPLTRFELVVTPADKEAIAAAQQAQTPETADQFQERLLLEDAKNFKPSMLFLLILPSEVEGYMIFVVRKKYKALAESILNNLAAFLIYYLELWKDPIIERTTLRLWLCKQHIEMTTRYSMTWDESVLSAVLELDRNAEMEVDETDDWLTALTPSTTSSEIFKGTISINLKLASVRGIDDGATVVSRINEIRRLQKAAQHHAEMVDELAAIEVTLKEKDQLAEQHLDGSKAKDAEQSGIQDDQDEEDSDYEDDGEEDDDDEDEEKDGDMAGKYEAADIDGSGSDDEDAQMDSKEGDNHGQHNDSLAQADAGGGSSGSGS